MKTCEDGRGKRRARNMVSVVMAGSVDRRECSMDSWKSGRVWISGTEKGEFNSSGENLKFGKLWKVCKTVIQHWCSDDLF